MMMNMLVSAGLEIVTDEVRTADEDNPKGYFEDERVKDLGEARDKSWMRDCRGKLVKVISFLLKDLPDEHYYKILFMRRDLDEVLASQNKMLVRRGEPLKGDDAKMADLYRTHLRKVEIMLEERPNFEHLDVPYREALESPREHAERVARFLQMSLDVDSMAAVVDKSLYRNRLEGAQSG